MIISKTPLRVSLAGGGSDFHEYYQHSPGAVVSFAIDKYMYLSVNKKFDSKFRIAYSHVEIVDNVFSIAHEIARECLLRFGYHHVGKQGVEVSSISDIPSEGSGLGSSSVYTVGLLNCLYAMDNYKVSPSELAYDACDVEIDCLEKPIGKQDQYASAYGGCNHITFSSDEAVRMHRIDTNSDVRDFISQNLCLVYTGVTRRSDKILSKQKENIVNSRGNTFSTFKDIGELVKLAQPMAEAITHQDLDDLSSLLNESWGIKRMMSEGITTVGIDNLCTLLLDNGASACKLAGAGGGGFIITVANPDVRKHLKTVLPAENMILDIAVDVNGSQIVFDDSHREERK